MANNNANTTPLLQYAQSGFQIAEASGSATYIQQNSFTNVVSPNGYVFPTSDYIQLQPRSVSFTPNTLGNTNHVYMTPRYEDLISLAQYFSDLNCSYQIQEGPVHTMTVSVPWDTITDEDWYINLFSSQQWELVPNVGQKSILYSGLVQTSSLTNFNPTGVLVLPVAIQGAIQNALANNQPGFTIPSGSALAATYASCSAVAQQTFQYLRAGIEGVPSYTQTLKRTAVVDVNNKTGAFQTAIDEFNQVAQTSGSYSYITATQDMINRYELPPAVKPFLLPSYSKKLGILGVDPYIYTVYAGWLIKPISFVFVGRNKIQMTQEFVWDEWAQGLYFMNSDISNFPLIYNATTALNGA